MSTRPEPTGWPPNAVVRAHLQLALEGTSPAAATVGLAPTLTSTRACCEKWAKEMSPMRCHTSKTNTAGPALAGLIGAYVDERSRVDATYTRMRALAAAPHGPAEARVATQELTDAVRQATTTVARTLRLLEPVPARRRLPRRRLASRSVPVDVAGWSAELVRLTQIGVWLRRTTLDELGAHVPTAVRVGSRAANGPHIAGMIANPDGLAVQTTHEPRIGVDLQVILDNLGNVPAPIGTAPSPTHAATSVTPTTVTPSPKAA